MLWAIRKILTLGHLHGPRLRSVHTYDRGPIFSSIARITQLILGYEYRFVLINIIENRFIILVKCFIVFKIIVNRFVVLRWMEYRFIVVSKCFIMPKSRENCFVVIWIIENRFVVLLHNRKLFFCPKLLGQINSTTTSWGVNPPFPH